MQGLINWGLIFKIVVGLVVPESMSDWLRGSDSELHLVSINLKIQIRQNSFIWNVWFRQWRLVDQMELVLFLQAKDLLQNFEIFDVIFQQFIKNVRMIVWNCDILVTKLRFVTDKRLNVDSNRCWTSNCTTGPQYGGGISMFKWVWIIMYGSYISYVTYV